MAVRGGGGHGNRYISITESHGKDKSPEILFLNLCENPCNSQRQFEHIANLMQTFENLLQNY